MSQYYPEPIVILNALTAAPTPPVRSSGNGWGLVPASWKGGSVVEFDLEVFAADDNDVTGAKLLAGRRQTIALADDDVDTVDATDNELDIASHAYVTGDGPIRLSTTDTLPSGLAEDTDYWIIVVSSGAISLAESFERAMNNQEIDFGAGSAGTHTVVDTDETKRVYWHSMGLLGEAADGALSLTAAMAYTARVKHSLRTDVYGLVATFSDTVATTARLLPLPLTGR